MKKIRNKLLLVLLIVSLLPALFIGASALWTTRANLQTNAINMHITKVSLLSERIEHRLSTISNDLAYLGDSNALNLYISSSNNQASHSRRLLLNNLRSSLLKFSKQKTIFREVSFIDKTGTELVKIIRNGTTSKALSDTHLINVRDSKTFIETMKLDSGEIYVSDYQLKRDEDNKIVTPHQPELIYSMAIADELDTNIGTLLLSLDTTFIDNLIKKELDDDTQLYFIDSNGFFYFHNENDKRWGQTNNLATDESLFTQHPPLKDKVSQATNSFYVNLENVIAAYSPVKNSVKNHQIGTIISIIDDSSLFKSANNFMMVFLGIILITLLSTFIIALMLSNSFTRPIIELTENVDQLSKGELETPIDSKSDDEIGKLAQSIERLRKSMNILMKRASSH